MTINKYFQNQFGDNAEQNLAEDLIIEAIAITGRDYLYIPRELNNIDEVLGEIALSSFSRFKIVEMWIANSVDGLAANNLLNLGFGIQANNTIELVVSRKRFNMAVQALPLAGDLVYDTLSKILYEIDYCDSEPSPSYQLQKLYTYTLRCNLFTYSYETMATGTQIDDDLNSETYVDPFDKTTAISTEAENDFEQVDNPFGTDLFE